jgi:hypothetical protein
MGGISMSAVSAGRVLIILRGEYDSNTPYEMLDAVRYDGSLYIAKKSVMAVTPEDGEYWMLCAEGTSRWGNIAGTLENQTDLKTALDAKMDNPESGTTGEYLQKTETGVTWNPVSWGNIEGNMQLQTDLYTTLASIKSNFAQPTVTPTETAFDPGQFVLYWDNLYRVTKRIEEGGYLYWAPTHPESMVNVEEVKIGDILTDLYNRSAANSSSISALDTRVTTNAADIVTVTSKANTNANDISTLNTKVGTNTSNISSLTTKVNTNTSNISTVTTKAETNATNISTLTTNYTNLKTWKNSTGISAKSGVSMSSSRVTKLPEFNIVYIRFSATVSSTKSAGTALVQVTDANYKPAVDVPIVLFNANQNLEYKGVMKTDGTIYTGEAISAAPVIIEGSIFFFKG